MPADSLPLFRPDVLLSSDTWVAEVKKLRGGASLSAGGLKRLREEYEKSVRPLVAEKREAEVLERQIRDAVNAAYGLTREEVTLMWHSAATHAPCPTVM